MATDVYPGDLGTYVRTYVRTQVGRSRRFCDLRTYVRTFVTLWAEAVALGEGSLAIHLR